MILAQWSFATESPPKRLKDLSILEAKIRKQGNLTFGFADRYQQVIQQLEQRKPFLPFQEIIICEDSDLIHYHYNYLLKKVQAACKDHCQIQYQKFTPAANPASDLGKWQSFLFNTKEKKAGQSIIGDGSLAILHAPSSNEAASFLAKTIRNNSSFQPVCFLPDQARQLDQALIQEGLPSLGIPSTSSARPSLQLLKLTPTFLWEPIDPYKVIEFVSLAIKPIDKDLGKVIGGLMAKSPGIQSDQWNRTIRQFFQRLENHSYSEKQIQSIQSQYRFWFTRKRFPIDQLAPKAEAISLFSSLQIWAYELASSDTGNQNPTLYVLAEQAKRIREILESLPEQEVSNLQLEQIVRTIYEPAPVTIREEEKGRMPYAQKAGAILESTEQLVWWNFTSGEPDYFFSRWYQPELEYLENLKIHLETPDRDNQRVLKRRIIPILQCSKQLLLVIPEQIHGVASTPHPLLGDLTACFSDLNPIFWHTSSRPNLPILAPINKAPNWEVIEARPLAKPQAILNLPNPKKLGDREQETFTSLQALFYYPYQWLFRHQLKLRASSILSVVKDQTLMGNLAHRLFEKLLSDRPIGDWNRETVFTWVDENLYQLLREEGSVLLLYGREPERIHFRNTLQFSSWALVEQLQKNDWMVQQSEMVLEGSFAQVAIKGIADLVLNRGQEKIILDLKWRGSSYREREVKNEEDLQLTLYAHLLDGHNKSLPHTAYFIINKARILARNNEAFQEINGLVPDHDPKEIASRIYERMLNTFTWRIGQLQKGHVEIRCEQTIQDLEDHYADQEEELLDLLEMKNQDAAFDDYRTLIGLVQ